MFFTVIGIGVFCYGLFHVIILSLLDCDLQLAFYEKFGKSVRRLKGRVVFITGASSGIGEHIAYALAKRGVKLVLAARRITELERVKRNCLERAKSQLNENDILVVMMDMLDFSSHKRVFDRAVQHFGQVDILVNNAGRSQRAAWENIDLAVDKEMFDLNVFSVVNLTRIAVKYFNTRGYGHVAVTSSLAGVIGVPLSATYDGSKHSLHGYFNCLRSEKTGSDLNLAVTLLCPGPTFSNFLQEAYTAKPGEKYGVEQQATDRRMTGDRCGELCAVALVNKTQESWMSVFPLIPFTYMWVYFPTVRTILMKIVGPQKLFKLRDSRDIVLDQKNRTE